MINWLQGHNDHVGLSFRPRYWEAKSDVVDQLQGVRLPRRPFRCVKPAGVGTAMTDIDDHHTETHNMYYSTEEVYFPQKYVHLAGNV